MTDTHQKTQPIAIVGASALFPGATDSDGFWRNVLEGNDLITDVPPSHWLIDDYYDPDPKAKDKTYAKRGAFLPKIDFDALGFGVPPSIIPATDTAQLLALIVAQRVLNDAAQGQFETLDREKISVVLGVTSAQELLGSMVARLQRPVWEKALRDAGLPESQVIDCCERISNEYTPWQESSFPGVLGNVVAGRIANRFDLGGTNCVTDAACASTFSAVSMAVNELYLGQSDLVITGGVDTMNDIFMYMCFSKTPALSHTGDCRPFSDQADGTMLGEGIGMVALKRLADAERDGDRIYAVLHGVGSSSDGRAKSVYAPVPKGQSKALRRAYERAGYAASTVELVEGHGTGTVAGDAAEFEGLRLGFMPEVGDSLAPAPQWCALGSVKSQIGHTKAAAGAAGLFKVVMALQHKVLPPTIKVERPNPKMDLETSPFYLNLESKPWVRGSDHPRRGSISSFGFGGSNFHLALEEYTGPNAALKMRTCDTELVVLSAATPEALVIALAGLAVPADGLRFVAHRSQADYVPGRPARVAISATSEADLSRKLKLAADKIAASGATGFSAPGVHYAHGETPGKTAFLFPGQGSQYLAMGAGPAMTWEPALAAWDLSADIAMDPTLPLHDVVFPKSTFGDSAKQAQAERLVRTEWAQPGIGATSLSYLRLLESLGVQADCVGGHSFGEVTALHAAGALDARTMLAVARRRGELMRDAAATPGAMTAVTATIDAVTAVIKAAGTDVVVANHNSPNQVVLSGETPSIEAAEKALDAAGLRFQRLTVATAFHSKVVAASAKPFAEFLATVTVTAPTRPVYANSLAAPYPADADKVRAVLSAAVAAPVRFVEQIEAMWNAGVRVFVEVGPGSILTGLVGKILGDRPHRAISTDKKGAKGVGALHDALAQLVVAGVPCDLLRLWDGFRLQPDPASVVRPKLAVPLDGSNYGKPYPPVGGSAARPGPNPERQPEIIVKEVEVIREVEVVREVLVPTGPGATAPEANGAWIAAYQESQRQTAETHAAWQQAMSQTHLAFLAGVEQSFQSLTATLVGRPAEVAPVVAAPVVAARIPASHVPVAVAVPPVAARPVSVPVAVAVPPVAARPVSVPAAVAARPLPAPVVAKPTPAPREAAPIATSQKAAPALDLTALLLSVVADKTGYPADMLDLNMSLEADLGIDSIKRVEILAAMTERAPELPEVDTAQMARLATLQEIVTYMGGTLAATAPAASPAPVAPDDTKAAPLTTVATTVAPKASGLGRWIVEAVPAAAPGLGLSGLFGCQKLVITDDHQGVAAALAAQLGAVGRSAAVVHIDAVPADADGVIILEGLRDPEAAANRRAFLAARQIAKQARLFVTVQDTGGNFGLSGSDRAILGGLPGLAKTAAQEWPEAGVKAIDLQRGDRDAQTLAATLLHELTQGGSALEVCLPIDGVRRELRATRTPALAGALVINKRSFVVASGGARGVTAATLIALAHKAQPRIALLGRTPLADEPACCAGATDDASLKQALLAQARAAGTVLKPADLRWQVEQILAAREVQATLRAMHAAGSEARYVATDVTDLAAVTAALAPLRAEWGGVTAIVHGAGVLADKLIVDKTPEQFDRVFDTKVHGLVTLLEATADDELEALVLFSSVAARSGNAGQCDYAMANEVLNKIGSQEALRRPRCVVRSLNWGPWESGMVTPQLRTHFEAAGVPLIPLAEGAQMMLDELSPGGPVEVVLGAPPVQTALIGGKLARRFDVQVGRQSHPELGDHTIAGVPVLPVVQVVEWFTNAARATRPDLETVGCRQLEVRDGVKLAGFETGGDRFSIHSEQIQNGSGAELLLQLRAGDKVHYTAKVDMARDALTAPAAPKRAHAGEAWKTEIYDGAVLFHGPDFQVIRSLDGVSDEGISGQVTSESGLRNLDGGLQMALLWARHKLGKASLPMAVGSYRGYKPLAGVNIDCVVTSNVVGRYKTVSDVRFERDGEVLAELQGVESVLLP